MSRPFRAKCARLTRLPGRRWQVAGLAAVLLSAAGICSAAHQWKESVHWLGTDGWQLCEKDGEPCLVEFPADRRYWEQSTKAHRMAKDKAQTWRVSAPTIKGASGKLLAADPEGRDPSVHLVSEKGPHAEWVFEFLSALRPTPANKVRPTRADLNLGTSGFTFRVKIAQGPFKGWYLAGEDPAAEPKQSKDQQPATKPLKLVDDVKKATVFTFIEEVHYINNHIN